MKLKKVYHLGIAVDDIDRARDFYTRILGMEFVERLGGNPDNPDALAIHGKVPRLDRLRCGPDEVVLFERPRPIAKDALDQDGIAHHAFDMDWAHYEEALSKVKEIGKFHRSVERRSGKTIYMFDSEGNYLELHFPNPERKARAPAAEG
jgi:catechol 2,3-dioxygenase-like lactoylglutathione lyase family enzyme